jgi:hypothetical protein
MRNDWLDKLGNSQTREDCVTIKYHALENI